MDVIRREREGRFKQALVKSVEGYLTRAEQVRAGYATSSLELFHAAPSHATQY
jgi:hypothetical protein